MPLDAVCLSALVDELAPELEGAHIDKVQQPARTCCCSRCIRGAAAASC